MVSKHLSLNKFAAPLLALLLIVTGVFGELIMSSAPAYAAAADGPSLTGCDKQSTTGVITGTCTYNSDGLTPTPPTVGTSTGYNPTGPGSGRGFYSSCSYVDLIGKSQTNKYPIGDLPWATWASNAYSSCDSYAGTVPTTSKTEPTTTPAPPYNVKGCVPKEVNGKAILATDVYSWTNGIWVKTGTNKWTLTWYSACVYPSPSSVTPTKTDLGATGYCLTGGTYSISYGGAASINANSGGTALPGGTGSYTTKFKYNASFQKNGPSASNPCTQDLKISWKNIDAPVYTSGPNIGKPLYSFYRVTVKAQGRQCRKVVPPSWTNEADYYECDPVVDAPTTYYRYTYTCTVNGMYEASGNPEQVKASDAQYFDVTNCVGNYTCSVGATKIAGKVYSAANGAADVTVMRNGKQVPVAFGAMTLSANPNISGVHVTTRVTTVPSTASPYNPAYPVDNALQPFKLYRNGTATNFATNTDPTGTYTLAFLLASNPGSTWTMKSSYLYTATFKPYVQSTWTSSPHRTSYTLTGQSCKSSGNDGAIQYSNSARVVVARAVNVN